jgi:hypothetical protein
MSLALTGQIYFNTLMSGIGIPSTQRWLKGQLGYCIDYESGQRSGKAKH